MNVYTQTAEKFASIWEKEHISHIAPSDVRHADLKNYLDQLKKLGLAVNEVGRSNANREIYQIEFGHGSLKVFMWSQMHGDEPTATSALMDMLAWLQKNHKNDLVKKIADTMTIRAVPMLNPDGEEMYQRRNLQGIDINRDAIDLKTPEARLLKQLRDDWSPAIGFNLHNQGALTTVGHSPSQASISLLVVYGDAAKTTNSGLERNTRLASQIVLALQKFIPGHIARYGDEYTASAFGDNFSAWGTPVILIETGALYGKDEMFLVKMNFVAFMTVLESLAIGSEQTQDTAPYVSLIENGSGGLVNFIFRRATIVNQAPPTPAANAAADLTSAQPTPVPTPTTLMSIADLAAVTERRRASLIAPTTIRSVGELSGTRGLEEYDASGFNVRQRFGNAKTGELAEFFFYKKGRVVDWASLDLEKQFPPDAIFSTGKWIKGQGIVPKM